MQRAAEATCEGDGGGVLDDALLMVELAAGRFHTVLHGIPRLPAHETGVHTCGSGQKDESRLWGKQPRQWTSG